MTGAPSTGLPATLCLFIGHPRTGHSIVGASLDAHPDAVIAHEFNALRAVELGWTRGRIILGLVATAEEQARRGRIQGRYRYEIPGGWHGRYRELRVIGDKTAYATTNMLREKPWLLARIVEVMQTDLKLVHALRNPFDCISTNLRHLGAARTEAHLRAAVDQFFREADTNARIVAERPDSVQVIYHEALIADPAREIAKLCRFLGLAVEPEHLACCAAVVWKTPRPSRHEVDWNDAQIEMIESRAAGFPWLRHYSFTDT